MNLNLKSKQNNTYDAIVVGTGISGGWSAKELTEKGLKTLVLDRGRMVKHGDYPTANKDPWELPYGDLLTSEELKQFPKQNRSGYTLRQSTKHWWVNDLENPYTETKRFDWIRGYHVGGRSITWGRHSYRWSAMDFEANEKEGIAVPWPIGYSDIEPWYDYAEKYAGIQGMKEGLSQCPDGQFLKPFGLNCVETDAREKVMSKFPGRVITGGRTAHATTLHNGRKCQVRDLCIRGCPYGGYFSSVSTTLISAENTGNMTIRPNSIVTEVIYDEEKEKVTGVRVLDSETMETEEYYANVIFLNASAIASAFILMNSKSDRFPDGLGNDSGELGHNIMDHQFRTGARGDVDGYEDKYYSGRRPSGIYIPRFANVGKDKRDYLRGFGYQGGASRTGWWRVIRELTIGPEIKEMMSEPGGWSMGLGGFGECLPYHENKMEVNSDKQDKYGQPIVNFDVEFKENEAKMRPDMMNDAAEMLEAAGFKNVNTYDAESYPGLGIHEMGSARMGKDPKTSVLNKWNQVHAAKNVFVTDGACMTSSACQNPSLTYMALAARAANYAVDELKKQNL